jgi:hypothetical protein
LFSNSPVNFEDTKQNYDNLKMHSDDCNKINMTSVTSEAGTVYHSGAPDFTYGYLWGSC